MKCSSFCSLDGDVDKKILRGVKLLLTSFGTALGVPGLLANPAQAVVIAQHSGNTNPTAEGFTNNLGAPPAPGSASGSAWNISGSWCCTYALYSLTPANMATLTTAPSWTLTATFSNLSPDTGPVDAGSYADVGVGPVRVDLNLNSDGLGNQILTLDGFTGSPEYTIPGLGTGSVTLSFTYNNATHSGNAYVNGVEVIANYRGYSGTLDFLAFGGEDGDFAQVELLTSTVGVPEPAGATLLAAGLLALGLVRRRRVGRTFGAMRLCPPQVRLGINHARDAIPRRT